MSVPSCQGCAHRTGSIPRRLLGGVLGRSPRCTKGYEAPDDHDLESTAASPAKDHPEG